VKFEVGDLVQYKQGPQRFGIVVMTHTTNTGAEVCEIIIVIDSEHPETVGQTRYTNQEYWLKVETPLRPLDASIEGCVDEYEDAIDLHKTYGES